MLVEFVGARCAAVVAVGHAGEDAADEGAEGGEAGAEDAGVDLDHGPDGDGDAGPGVVFAGGALGEGEHAIDRDDACAVGG